VIAVLDTGLSNVGSVVNMLRRLGHVASIVTTPDGLHEASRIIVPGVGHFHAGMERLRESGLDEAVKRAARQNKPVLGICLGMQLLCRHSEEGDCEGLGLLPAHVVRFDPAKMAQSLPVPHMGWQAVRAVGYSPLLKGMEADARFYFTHSYHVVSDDPSAPFLEADYGYSFVAAAQKGSVAGVQFHPEKSHAYGKQLLKMFAEQTRAS